MISYWCMKVLDAQLYMTLHDSMDCSPLGSSVYGILQTRILEWVAIPFSRGSSQSSDWTWVSCIASRFFTVWATRILVYGGPLIHTMWLVFNNKRKEIHRRINTMWLRRIQEKNLPAKHWHLLSASTGINHEPRWLVTFNNPSKEFGVEVRNEALCALRKTERTGL